MAALLFVAVYINHRPVYGLAPTQFIRAFKHLGRREEGAKEWSISRPTLLSVLQERGEFSYIHFELNTMHLHSTEGVYYILIGGACMVFRGMELILWG